MRSYEGGGRQGVDTGDSHVYQWPPRLGRGDATRAIGSGVVAAMLLGQLVACQRGSSATLSERAKKYWELKQQKRWEEVYDGYVDPALKGALTKDTFLKKRLLAFDILSYVITDATENGEEGTVRVKLEANLPLRGIQNKSVEMLRKEMNAEDSWVRRGGTWYVRLDE